MSVWRAGDEDVIWEYQSSAAPEYSILPSGSNLPDSEQPSRHGELHVTGTSDTEVSASGSLLLLAAAGSRSSYLEIDALLQMCMWEPFKTSKESSRAFLEKDLREMTVQSGKPSPAKAT